jgi:peptidoglycan/LPS O-acetylase OafA/YrhL
LFLTNFALAKARMWDWLPLSVLWSLAIEEQFYLSAPWVVRMIAPAGLPWLAGGLALLAWIGRIALLEFCPQGNFAVHVLMPLRMDALSLGVLLAWAVRNQVARPFFARLGVHWGVWLSCGLSSLVLLSLLVPREGSPILCLFGYTLLSTVFALIVAIVAGVRPPTLNRLLASRPLAHLGRHSYFIYLWHALIGIGIIRWLGGANFVLTSPAGVAIVALAIAATWMAATISWKYFEGPLVAWSQRQTY